MHRYEAALRTPLRFGQGPWHELVEVEVAPLVFRGRDYRWHSNLISRDGEGRDYPTLTTMQIDGDTYERVDGEIQRLLSALAYIYETPIASMGIAGAPSTEDGRTMYREPGAPGSPLRLQLRAVPAEIVVVDDAVLRHTLAHHREGMNTESPFFRFLAFWSAMDVAFDGDEPQRNAYLRDTPTRAGGTLRDYDPPPPGLDAYLIESSRNAIAHAIRNDPSRVAIDPDEPMDRVRITRDARLVRDLLGHRIDERWPYAAFAR